MGQVLENEVNFSMTILGFLVVCKIQLLFPCSMSPLWTYLMVLCSLSLLSPLPCSEGAFHTSLHRKREHESLCLHPEYPCKRLGMVARVCHCGTGCWEAAAAPLWDSPAASRSSRIRVSRLSEGPCLKETVIDDTSVKVEAWLPACFPKPVLGC